MADLKGNPGAVAGLGPGTLVVVVGRNGGAQEARAHLEGVRGAQWVRLGRCLRCETEARDEKGACGGSKQVDGTCALVSLKSVVMSK